jgi:hypothetical protein
MRYSVYCCKRVDTHEVSYSPVYVFALLVPGKVTKYIEQPAGRRPTFLKVIEARWVNLSLPEMIVWLCNKTVVDTREFAIYGKDFGWCNSRVRG